MWEGLQALVRLWDTNQIQELQSALCGRLSGKPFVNAQHLIDLFFNTVQRVQ